MPKKYEKLDRAIEIYVAEYDGLHPMYAQSLNSMAAEALGHVAHAGDKEWRLIDRRLQALKKAGRIQYIKGINRWRVA